LDCDFARDYILANFKASDRLAVVVLDRQTKAAMQRISSAGNIASEEFQAWLRHRNAQGNDIYLSMNTLKPEADRRTKDNVGEIRHIYLDFDHDAEAAVRRLLEDAPLFRPSHIVRTSPDKRHVIWRVEGFRKEETEGLQKHLAGKWGADPAATDSARVLRLPGFYNHKYGVPYRVRTESGRPDSSRLYGPADFPEISLERLSPAARDRHIRRSTSLGPALTQSERDWSYAKRALARGESIESVIASVADYRRNDKSDPEYYATHTVRKAAASLGNESADRTGLLRSFER